MKSKGKTAVDKEVKELFDLADKIKESVYSSLEDQFNIDSLMGALCLVYHDTIRFVCEKNPSHAKIILLKFIRTNDILVDEIEDIIKKQEKK